MPRAARYREEIIVTGRTDPSVDRSYQYAERRADRFGRRAGKSVRQYSEGLRRSGRMAEGSVERTDRSLRRLETRYRTLGHLSGRMNRGMGRLGTRLTALAGGAGIGLAVRHVANLEERFERLGVQASLSTEKTKELKKKIFEIAQGKDIRIDPSELTAGVEQIVNKLGDLPFAEKNLRNIALLIQATGAAGGDAGAMIANMLEKFNIRDPQQILKVLDTMTLQGKKGSFTLQNLATQGNRVTAAYAGLGRTGPMAAREMGALLQVFNRATGSPEQTATALDGVLRELTKKAGEFEGLGVTIWDEAEFARSGKKIVRSVLDILTDLFKATGGDIEKLSGMFGEEAMRGLKAVMKMYRDTGTLGFEKFMKISGDGKKLQEDSARLAAVTNSALTDLNTKWKEFADQKLSGPIKELTDLLDGLEPETIKKAMEYLLWGVGGLGAILAGRAVAGGLRSLTGLVGGVGRLGKKALGKGGLPGLPGLGGTVPVYVTNFPPRFGGSGKGRTTGAATPINGSRTGVSRPAGAKIAPRSAPMSSRPVASGIPQPNRITPAAPSTSPQPAPSALPLAGAALVGKGVVAGAATTAPFWALLAASYGVRKALPRMAARTDLRSQKQALVNPDVSARYDAMEAATIAQAAGADKKTVEDVQTGRVHWSKSGVKFSPGQTSHLKKLEADTRQLRERQSDIAGKEAVLRQRSSAAKQAEEPKKAEPLNKNEPFVARFPGDTPAMQGRDDKPFVPRFPGDTPAMQAQTNQPPKTQNIKVTVSPTFHITAPNGAEAAEQVLAQMDSLVLEKVNEALNEGHRRRF